MKITTLKFTLFISTFLIISCSQDNTSINTKLDTSASEFNQRLSSQESSTILTKFFMNLGVVEILSTHESDSIVYNFVTEKEFFINDEFVNLRNYPITMKDGEISLNSNPNLKLTILNDQPYLNSPSYSGFLESEEFFRDKEINILLFFMKEIITTDDFKYHSNDYIINVQSETGCSFWDTHYIFATGGSASVAEANLPAAISHYTSGFNTLDVSHCRQFGSVDTSCVWGNHLCISTQAFCCD